MRTLKLFSIIFLSVIVCIATASCKAVKTDNGKHKGWFKNTNNPHHPLTTNPGHTKSTAKGSSSPSGKAKKK